MLKDLRNSKNLSFVPVIVWLFIQLSMTGMFSPASASTSEVLSSTGYSSTITICTSTGFKQITLNEDGSVPSEAPDEGSFCPWCMHFGDLTLLVAPIAGKTDISASTADVLWFSVTNKFANISSGTYFQSRAPPFKQ